MLKLRYWPLPIVAVIVVVSSVALSVPWWIVIFGAVIGYRLDELRYDARERRRLRQAIFEAQQHSRKLEMLHEKKVGKDGLEIS